MEIVFDNVSCSFNKKTNAEKSILNNISFKINESKIYGFLGNSNSGKTLIAELILFLESPTSGSIKVDSYFNNGKKLKDINKLRSSIGYVYKNPQEMFITNSVKKEIEFGMKYFNYKIQTINKRTKDSLRLVGLDESFLNENISNLSLSEQRKLEIACVLSFNPKLIILDEPTIGLNEREKKDLIRLIRIMKNKYGRTVIILTKDTDFLYKIVDYVYILNKGQLEVEGTKSILTDMKLLNKLNLYLPKCLNFVNYANEFKDASLEYYEEVGDLIKGVYRSVS